jgi:hypothetical protein
MRGSEDTMTNNEVREAILFLENKNRVLNLEELDTLIAYAEEKMKPEVKVEEIVEIIRNEEVENIDWSNESIAQALLDKYEVRKRTPR